jgi:GDP-L-fucose synthase
MSSESVLFSQDSRVFVAGHRGMVGSAIVRQLVDRGHENIITRTSRELDLCNQRTVRAFFEANRIDFVILAAAKVGGIHANSTYPAEFIYINQMIQCNVIHEAYRAGVKRLLFLGSSCIYPKFAPQPMKEEHLLTGILEPTNEPYAIAKIAGIKMCESYNRQYKTDFRAVMPTNLYGPGDNYNLENSHVIPAILRKYHLAKIISEKRHDELLTDEQVFGPLPADIKKSLGLGKHKTIEPQVVLWGTGTARREFLHVDDMASACLHILGMNRQRYRSVLAGNLQIADTANHITVPSFVNIGTGRDCEIRDVAEIIRGIVGFQGITRYNSDQPDGTPRKLLETSRINLSGWTPRIHLKDGLADTYRWYCSQLIRK